MIGVITLAVGFLSFEISNHPVMCGVAFFVLVMLAVVTIEGTNEEIEQVAEDCMVERWRQG